MESSQLSIQEPQLLQNQNPHDDFLNQILSTIPNCTWSSSNPNPNSAILAADSPPHDHHDAVFHCPISNALHFQGGEDGSLQALYNGFSGSFQGNGGPPNIQQFQPPLAPGSTGGKSAGTAPQRQRVRARRGQATDPHSIAERIRRERIAERMKGLQELVPNGNKTDKASMLDEIIDYVKFLQLQVKVLSMSRLGGATAVAPQIPAMPSEGGGSGRTSNGNLSNDNMTTTEQQVSKLMDEDLGSAMQYLQRKGLCLMPISLATAISTVTCQPRNLSRTYTGNDHNSHNHSLLPSDALESAANMSGLTVLSGADEVKNASKH